MITYLYVSDAPWIAHSGVDGQTIFHDLPAGAYNVRVAARDCARQARPRPIDDAGRR